MAYTVPQVELFQEFEESPAAITDPLRGIVVGPHAQLIRYSDSDEKLLGDLGAYDPLAATEYAWPQRAAGAIIDHDYTKLYIDDALLLYFSNSRGAGATVAPVANYANRIRSSADAFKTNGADYLRNANLYDRDVTVGDTAYVSGVVDGDTYELWTYVRDIAYEQTAATATQPTPGDSNGASQSQDSEVTQIAGLENCVGLHVDASTYNGLLTGFLTEVYTVEVIQASDDTDLSAARLRITSESGADNKSSIAPEDFETYKTFTTAGLRFKFTNSQDGSSCSSGNADTAYRLLVGQKWRVTVSQVFEAVHAQSKGTYTGTTDTTYIVEVTKGGAWADEPTINVTTTHGTDVSGPTVVTGHNAYVPIGTKALQIRFYGVEGQSSSSKSSQDDGTWVEWDYPRDPVAGLRKGDKWYITVTAAANGRAGTLVLANNLPTELLDATDLDLKLYIKKDIQVERNRVSSPPNVNFEEETTQIIVNDGIEAYDATWTDDGDPLPLPVISGRLYVEYRAWRQDLVGTIFSGIGDDGLAEISGPTHPDNPIKWAFFKATTNSNGTPVKYTAVSDPSDQDDWEDALELLVGVDDIYNLVPLTHTRGVIDLFVAHVNAQSAPDAGRWRAMFCCLPAVTSAAIVSSESTDDGDTVLATLSDNPNATGTQYTRLQVPAQNANFLANGVAAGDIVRFLYATDAFGEVSYEEFVVDTVTNEDELILLSGHTVAISVAQKIEVWHNRNKTEIATALAVQAQSFANRRVCMVWPDVVGSAGLTYEGYHLAAALAGYRSGIVPHAGLTRATLSGFDDLTRTHDFFNATQLNIMAEGGIWIVTRERDGTIVTRHATTTDVTDVNRREEMIRANVDSVSYYIYRRCQSFIGQANVTASALKLLKLELEAAIGFLKSNEFTERLGAQLIDGEVIQVRQHAVLADRVVVVLDLTFPAPMNNIEIHLII
jgi:hypothetical protein